MEFEFDPLKSETNKAKHGIDFIEAQALWRSKHVLLGAKVFRKALHGYRPDWLRYLAGDNHLSRRDDSDYWGNPLQARSTRMKKSQADATTAGNLEEKFDLGEDVLDYFDVRKARVIDLFRSSSGIQ